MIGAFGHLATLIAFLLSLLGAALGIFAGARRHRGLWRAVRRIVAAVFLVATSAVLAMVYALVRHDFSVSYVARVGSRSTPIFYTVVSLWSSLDGSLLFWAWLLAGFSFAVVLTYRRRRLELLPYVAGTMLAVGAFFWFLVTWPANPFAAVFPVPPDGPGPNPLLQNHPFMALHPPLLYLGYIGMTVPFAFAMGALMSGRLDEGWLRMSRAWMSTAWVFLTWGIVGGGWWSYEVLGWGGYWAWDPVENASLMPWLTATALLHSAMVQERRRMMRTWNIVLVVSTFALTLLGTFLTRSGILGSVHAFSEGVIGPLFLGFISLTLLIALGLIGWRSDRLKVPGVFDSLLSREVAFLLNNLLLSGLTFMVLLGTLFPLIVEIARGVRVSVGAPYFDRMGVPLLLALVFLLGVGPALAWRRTSRRPFRRKMTYASFAALIGGSLGWLAGARGAYTVLTFAASGFAIALNLAEFWIPSRARMRAHGERGWQALRAVVLKAPRRYGGYVVHVGVVVIAIAIAASSSFQIRAQATLAVGDALRVGQYELRLDSLYAGRESNRDFVAAGLSVSEGGVPLARLAPRMNYYPTSDQPIVTPAVRSRLWYDLYVTLRAYERDGSSATVEAIVNPLIAWLWIGALIMAAGALLALRRTGKGIRPPDERSAPDLGVRTARVSASRELEEVAS